MKGKKPSDNRSVKSSSGKTSNIFLNVIIVILSGLIIFMSYSLVTKILAVTSGENEDENKSPRIIQLEVMNGCGITGVAEEFTNYLRKNNFDVVEVGNYRSFDINNTLVVDRTGNKKNALRVAEALGINSKNVIQQINNDYFLDVSLIIGKDFNQLNPYNN